MAPQRSRPSEDLLKVTDQGRKAGSAIAAALIADGWSGSPELNKYAATSLVRSYDGYKVNVVVQAFSDSVLASGSTKHKRVCRSAT